MPPTLIEDDAVATDGARVGETTDGERTQRAPACDARVRPEAPAGAPLPSISMSGVPAKPGCVLPSMTTGWVTAGSSIVGLIV